MLIGTRRKKEWVKMENSITKQSIASDCCLVEGLEELISNT